MAWRWALLLATPMLACFASSAVSGEVDASRSPSSNPALNVEAEIPGNGIQTGGDQELFAASTANAESADLLSTHDTGASPCSCESCQEAVQAKQAALKKAAASAYAPLFFNNQFNYLYDPEYDDCHLGEDLKRLGIGNHSTLDIGGQYRARMHNERNMRSFGLTGVDDDFLLHRTRLYMNGQVNDRFRVYAEMIDAESNYENFAPRAIEVNRTDMLNLFVDAKLLEFENGDLSARVGRQELLYGAQRLVSPLDWANTRRNFDGVNLQYKGTEWNIDTFFTRPVVVDPHNFDSPDENQDFAGTYSSYKGRKNETMDLYYLHYRNGNASQGPNGLYFETVGGRWQGSSGNFVWEFEGGYQFGKNRDDSNHDAGFLVGGLGRKFDHSWKPTLWTYYDWTSGGNVLGGRQGFDQLFPLSHRYFGFMDFYARSNIESPSVLFTCQPREKVQLLVWYHYFFLQTKNDTPYNVNMTPFNPANAPVSASLGQEIDTTLQWSITPRTDLLFGYSHFFAGDYYRLTPGVPYRGDADFFYTQFTVNF